MTPIIELINEPGPEIRQAIGKPLKHLNDVRAGYTEFHSLALTVMAPGSRDIIGGLWGETGRGYMYVVCCSYQK